MNPDSYKADPCGASSLSFRKTNLITVPDTMLIQRDDAFTGVPEGYSDTVYFRMIHDLKGLAKPQVPNGFSYVSASPCEFAAHISACYDEEFTSASELQQYMNRDTYRPDLWIALGDNRSGVIAASGIAELDRDIGEGTLEWIQVSPAFRRRGLGSSLVRELLFRMKDAAVFVTVSGRLDNKTDPYALYLSCGFRSPVLWHIMRKDL